MLQSYSDSVFVIPRPSMFSYLMATIDEGHKSAIVTVLVLSVTAYRIYHLISCQLDCGLLVSAYEVMFENVQILSIHYFGSYNLEIDR